jgi:uncharacterized protein YjbI with pentapeptide repeats
MKIFNMVTGKLLLEIEDLSGANLSGANLSGANLSRADLSWADLSWADLSRADLSGANLSGANLSGANLSGANLIVGGQRSDGYRFLAFRDSGEIFISAGCRYLPVEQARAHWQKTRGGTRLDRESQVLINQLEEMAKIAGWIEEKVR